MGNHLYKMLFAHYGDLLEWCGTPCLRLGTIFICSDSSGLFCRKICFFRFVKKTSRGTNIPLPQPPLTNLHGCISEIFYILTPQACPLVTKERVKHTTIPYRTITYRYLHKTCDAKYINTHLPIGYCTVLLTYNSVGAWHGSRIKLRFMSGDMSSHLTVDGHNDVSRNLKKIFDS